MTRRVAVTGVDGFVGRNLAVRLGELGDVVLPLTRASRADDWHRAIAEADAVVHLAGANRPADPTDFMAINAGTAELLAASVIAAKRAIPVIYASSAKALDNTDYGRSKRAGEDRLLALTEQTGSPVYVFRLPNVFGKWARPNYNSAIATFCHNIAREMPIRIDRLCCCITGLFNNTGCGCRDPSRLSQRPRRQSNRSGWHRTNTCPVRYLCSSAAAIRV
jgi:UDP-2-acetamido-2,6-beta-L-arabino-hexul-4-ose reductase